MANTSSLICSTLIKRYISTSSKHYFKFKLTDEMIREHQEKQKAQAEEEGEQSSKPALHTQEAPLIMARVSSERYKKVIKVGVPKHRLNEYFLLYVREQDNIHAYDENDVCKPGDWVLLRRHKEPLDKDVAHSVERVVYSYGNYIDPITGRRSLGFYFDDDMKRLETIKVDL